MVHWEFYLSVAIVLTIFLPVNIHAKSVQNELVQQLIREAKALGLKIDESKIVASTKGENREYAAVPLITGNKLDVTRNQIANGEVYVAFQCAKTEKSSECYKIRLTDFVPKTQTLKTALVDENGKIIARSELEPTGKSKITPLRSITIQGPVRVFINGVYIGTYDLVIIYY